MKRILLSVVAILAFCAAAFWGAAQIEQAQAPQLSSLMPTGALLYIEAKDFSALLNDWSNSAEKRAWLAGDDYQAFSRSHLFERLSQAQDEFSAAAGMHTDNALLSSVAGEQSCLALYDIGNLDFLYITRMSQHDAENTPLWPLRSRFEQRAEGAAQFYVHRDPQSNRIAAFAALDGWLILGTREDLVAGALDRLQSRDERSLSDEAWYADSIKQAAGPPGDLRMALNLDKLVPSPYFRSYWVQQNITEMKQYASAVSDLYRSPQSYREERVLLRKPGFSSRVSGDVSAIASLAPADSDFYLAQAVTDSDAVLAALRNTLLEVKPATVESAWSAPPLSPDENAGSADMLDVRIDQAPVVAAQADPFDSLRTLLRSVQPAQMLQVGATSRPGNSGFVRIRTGMIIAAEQPWNLSAGQGAITAALQSQLTAGHMGLNWIERTGKSGSYSALDGRVPLYIAVRENRFYCANDADLLEQMLARPQISPAQQQPGLTYTAIFRHGEKERQDFRMLFARLDRTGNDANAPNGNQGPPFFSGNIESLSQMFANVDQETVKERDEGTKVSQTVSYHWTR